MLHLGGVSLEPLPTRGALPVMQGIATILHRASGQHGLITRDDLRDLGISDRRRDRLVATGIIERIGHRTFRVPGLPTTIRQVVMAAVLETGGVASHRTAAALHGIGPWKLGGPPAVLALRGTSAHHVEDAEVHTTTWLPPDDRITVDEIPCTSVARTILLLAAPNSRVGHPRLRDLVDEAIRDGKASDAWLWWRLEHLRRRGRPGIAALEAVLAARADLGPTESWLERELLRLLTEAGLPLPRCQARVAHRGSFVGRVDFLYDEARVAIEVSGHAFHASPEQLRADARRRNDLQLAGYVVLEFTYDEVVRSPHRVIAVIGDALGLT